MSRGAAAVEHKNAKHKNAEQYSKELCDIMMVNPISRIDKQLLFDKIFEILDQEVKRSIKPNPSAADSMLWYYTCNSLCRESTLVRGVMTEIFYTIGKPIFHRDIEIIRDSIGLPRVLFFELLLDLIEKLSEKAEHDYNKEYFEGFRKTVNESDSSGILSYGVSDIEYFIMVTNENVKKIESLLRIIDSKFTTDAPRQGNYTLAHVISSYCNGKLIEHHDRPSPSPSQSQSDSQPDLDPDLGPKSLMNVPSYWRGNIQLATQDDIKRYNAHKVSEEQRQKIEDTKRRDEEQVAQFILEREKHAHRMSEKKKPDDMEQKDNRPICEHAPYCYRQNAQHWNDYQHVGQEAPVERPKGGRRRQLKRSKYNNVRCSLSSAKRRTKRPRHTRHTTRRRTKHRRRH